MPEDGYRRDVARFMVGDPEAGERLCERYRVKLEADLEGVFPDRATLEEAMQDLPGVLVAMYREFTGGDFYAWAARTARIHALGERLFDLWDELEAYMKARLPSHVDVRDFLQQAFVELLAKDRPGRRLRHPLVAWVKVALRFRRADFFRERGRRRALHERHQAQQDLSAAVSDPPNDPIRQIELKEVLELLREALEEVAPKYRAALEDHLLRGLTSLEAAWRHGLAHDSLRQEVGKVRKRVRRAYASAPPSSSSAPMRLDGDEPGGER